MAFPGLAFGGDTSSAGVNAGTGSVNVGATGSQFNFGGAWPFQSNVWKYASIGLAIFAMAIITKRITLKGH